MSSSRHFFAWQGLNLSVPADWNAIKLEGTRLNGMALLADLESARLGLRWITPKKSAEPERLLDAALSGELGRLAADEAVDFEMPKDGWSSKLYVEPDPPGRDVWVGFSALSGRLIEVIYHARRRDNVLQDQILPALVDTPPQRPQQWSVLDLSCQSPAGFSLSSQHLSAGDLRLVFADGRRHLAIRQIGPAELALARQPLEKWLAQHPMKHTSMYRNLNTAGTADGGLQKNVARRRRFVLYRHVPPLVAVIAKHNRGSDRIVIVEAEDPSTAAMVMRDVGWARLGQAGDCAAERS